MLTVGIDGLFVREQCGAHIGQQMREDDMTDTMQVYNRSNLTLTVFILLANSFAFVSLALSAPPSNSDPTISVSELHHSWDKQLPGPSGLRS